MSANPRGHGSARRGARRKPARRAGRQTAPVALLAAALRAQSEGVFIAGCRPGAHGLKILFVNDSFCAMTGHSAGELLGSAHGLFHVARLDVERLDRWLPKAQPGQPLVGEGYLLRPDGGTIYASWSFDPLCNARGRVTHIVATYRDMTEKRRLQEALVHAQRLDAVGRLAGGVAHDFNNLLSVINGYCEILVAHVAANPQALREVTEIHAAGRKAAALTQQLLAFSRRQPLNSRVVNFNTLVRDNAEILRRLLGDAGRLELDLANDLANVRTDPLQFQQVLFNLVLNARDALRDRGRITIVTANREVRPGGQNRRLQDIPPGRYAVLTIADNGTGMDAETQKHLFEPFFTTKPEGKGTGLGLALVYGVVQQSGGYISVKSVVLVGSTFEVFLPTAPGEAESVPRLESVAPLPTTRGSEGVVLVEEDDVVRKMVAGILTTDGYEVTAVPVPAKALVAVRTARRPVQLFIGNAGGDGDKPARALAAAHAGLRVLNICAPDATAPLPWLPPAHQLALPKPFALSELVKAVRRLLDAP